MERQDRLPLSVAYRIMGLAEGATLEELRTQFKKMALKAHPDRGGQAREFNLLQEAFTSIWESRRNEREEKVDDRLAVARAARAEEVRVQEEKKADRPAGAAGFDLAVFNAEFERANEQARQLGLEEDISPAYQELMKAEKPVQAMVTFTEPVAWSANALAFSEVGRLPQGSGRGFGDLLEVFVDTPEETWIPALARVTQDPAHELLQTRQKERDQEYEIDEAELIRWELSEQEHQEQERARLDSESNRLGQWQIFHDLMSRQLEHLRPMPS